MNLYHISENIIQFNIFNLLGPIDGHITVFYKLSPDKQINFDNYVFCKKGNFGNLVSYIPVKDLPRFPTPEEKVFLERYIYDRLTTAAYYDSEKPWYERDTLILNGSRSYNVWREPNLEPTDLEREQNKKAIELLS